MQNQSIRRKLVERFPLLTGERGLMCLVIGLSAAVRVLYFVQVRDNPFLNHPRLDALFHDTWALSIAHGNVFGDQVFFRAPLYAYLLGLLYWIFGHDYFVVRIVQHLFGIGSVILVYLLCKRWFDARTGLLAAFLTAVNPMLFYFEEQLLFESLLTFLILVWLFLLARAIKNRHTTDWFFVGLVLGVLGITRPPVLGVGLMVIIIAAWKIIQTEQITRPIPKVVALVLGLLLAILPVTIRNYLVGNEFVFIASQGGVNFFIGNNPDADGISSSMPRRFAGSWENRNETYLVEKEIGHEPTASEESAFWYEKARRFITEEPTVFMSLLIKKAYLFWNHIEIPNNLNFNFFRQYSFLLDLNPFGFWLLGPLALLGMSIAFFFTSEGRGKTLLLCFVGLSFWFTVLFFVCDRYRAPLIPLFAIFGAHGIFSFYEYAKVKNYRRVFVVAIVTTLSCVLVNSNLYSVDVNSRAREYFTLGVISLNDRQNEKAAENFRSAYQLEPSFPNLAYNMGVTEWLRGNISDAVSWFRRELQLNPTSFNADINLARIYFARNSMDSVEYFAAAAIQSKPYLPPGYIWLAKTKLVQKQIAGAESVLVRGSGLCDENDFVYGEYLLGGIYSSQGRNADADTRFRSVLSRLEYSGTGRQPLYEPEFEYSNEQKIGEELNVLQAKTYYGLGHICISKRNLDSAAMFFALATKSDPEYADAFADLGVALLQLKRVNEAEAALRRAVILNPNHYLYWINYGDVLAFQQRYGEAKKAFEKSLTLQPGFLPAQERLNYIRQRF